jgi:diguanylate cyclase (GGDEF)-like protein
LHQLGKLLREHVRGDDIPCRYGGDEFILVLPDASLEVVQKRAEVLSENARQLSITLEEQKIGSISLSLGVAFYPMHGSTSAGLLKAADTALYRAKHQGKGRVAVAE